MKHLKRFNENISNYPKEIIATRHLYQPSGTMLWTDNLGDRKITDCNNYIEPVNSLTLKDITENNNNNPLLIYYEIEEGHTSNIIEITKKNLDFLIEFNLIEVLE